MEVRMFDIAEVSARLAHNGAAITALCRGVDRDQVVWRPAPEAWSLLEVLCHLLDEEREDFRQRLDLIIHHPDADWPPIDPQAWVAARAYADRNLDDMVTTFAEERAHSVAWLRGLSSPDWQTEAVHPVFGAMQAGTMLASWLAHDQLHLRQLAELHFAYIRHRTQGFSVDYAGEW
jgi:hypothetical protein